MRHPLLLGISAAALLVVAGCPPLEDTSSAPRPEDARTAAGSLAPPGAPSQQDGKRLPPEEYAAKLLGVPTSALEHVRDRIVVPPELAPPDGIIDRSWRLRRGSAVPDDQPVPLWLSLNLADYGALAAWGPPRSKARPSIAITDSEAERLSREWFGRRGFPVDRWTRSTDAKDGLSPAGVTSGGQVRLLYRNADPVYDAAWVTVDTTVGYVSVVWLLAPPQATQPSRSATIGPEEARELLEEELARRGATHATIDRQRLLCDVKWLEPGHPVYEFGVICPRPLDPNHAQPYPAGWVMDPQVWYVDGWDKRVGNSGAEFPELQRWNDAWRRWRESQKGRAGPSGEAAKPKPDAAAGEPHAPSAQAR